MIHIKSNEIQSNAKRKAVVYKLLFWCQRLLPKSRRRHQLTLKRKNFDVDFYYDYDYPINEEGPSRKVDNGFKLYLKALNSKTIYKSNKKWSGLGLFDRNTSHLCPEIFPIFALKYFSSLLLGSSYLCSKKSHLCSKIFLILALKNSPSLSWKNAYPGSKMFLIFSLKYFSHFLWNISHICSKIFLIFALKYFSSLL